MKYRFLLIVSCLLTGNLFAQYPNIEKDIYKPIRFFADSLFKQSATYLTPGEVNTIIMENKIQNKGSFKYSVATDSYKDYSSNAIYTKTLDAVGFVAMCTRPNPLRDVNLNPATAFALSEDGVCLTNFHVVYAYAHVSKESEKSVFLVRLGNGNIYSMVSILAISPKDDIALIKIDTRGTKIPFLKLKNKDANIGDNIYILGNPEGLAYNLSKGMVTNKVNTTIGLPGGEGGVDRNLIVVSADFAVGSSGSPVLDTEGSVVGMVSSTHVIQQNTNGHPLTQMVIKNTIPVSSIKEMINRMSK